MAVRTKQLANGVLTTTLTTVYTVPADKTAIVKSLVFYSPVGAATTTIFVSARIGGNARGITVNPGFAANTSGVLELWVVLGPTDELRVSANPSAAVQFIASGTELDGVA